MPQSPPHLRRPIDEIADEIGLYPVDAYNFVGQGLNFTVKKLKGDAVLKPAGNDAAGDKLEPAQADPKERHITGPELSQGLRDFALLQWGMLARAVLERWNIHHTDDFGRIVFALVQEGWLSKTDDDEQEDFRRVYDFDEAFVRGYRIECKL